LEDQWENEQGLSKMRKKRIALLLQLYLDQKDKKMVKRERKRKRKKKRMKKLLFLFVGV
jgi:hypothetical protein